MARGCAVFTQKPPPADRSPGGGVVTLSAVIEFADIVFRRLDDTVDADLEVQVRAAGITGTAAVTDDLALLDILPDRNGDIGHMGIAGSLAVAVVDDHRSAVAVVPAVIEGGGDGAGLGGTDGGAHGTGDIPASR